ncbi:MAG: hypothetical protein ABSF98_30070 [Bryobacteraceae bacterium]|jgi:hypothetical protein
MLVPVLFLSPLAGDPGLPLPEIMARVAANQDRAAKQRKQFAYQERVHIQSRYTTGKLARDETSEYEVFPDPDPKGPGRKLTKISGRYRKNGRYIDFTGQAAPAPNSLDEGLIQGFRDDMVDDFPLTPDQQKKYRFELLGEQDVRGRKAWRIGFRPADKNDIDWAGEALIDQQEFQPINVFTKLSRRIPFAVRTLLGTDLPGIGYNVTFQRVDEGVWLPASYGSEFTLHILFFLNREINVSMVSSGFRRAKVDAVVPAAAPQ